MMLKIIFGIAELLLVAWIYRKIAAIDGRNYSMPNQRQLTLPRYEKLIGFLSLLFFAFLIFAMMFASIRSQQNIAWPALLIFGLFMLLGLCLLWAYAVCRHSYDEHGLTYSTFFNKKIFLAWNRIDKMNYSSCWGYSVLISKTGEKFYIANNMVGLGQFMKMLRKKLPDKKGLNKKGANNVFPG